jgi:outer membrane autotransporter protein
MMQPYKPLNTRLLPLSVVISSLLSGAAWAAPSQPTPQDLVEQIINYAKTKVISEQQKDALMIRLVWHPEELKQQQAAVQLALAAAEEEAKKAKTEAVTTSIEKDQFDKAVSLKQTDQKEAQNRLNDARSAGNTAIKDVDATWTLDTNDLANELINVIADKDTKANESIQKEESAKKALQDQKEHQEKLQKLGEQIEEKELAITEGTNNSATGTTALNTKWEEAKQALINAENDPDSELAKAKAEYESNPDDTDKEQKYKNLLESFNTDITNAEESFTVADEAVKKLEQEKSALEGDKSAADDKTDGINSAVIKANQEKSDAEKTAKEAADKAEKAKAAQLAITKAEKANQLLEEAEQALAAANKLAKEAEDKFNIALFAKAEADNQLALQNEKLTAIGDEIAQLTQLADPTADTPSINQTIAKGEKQTVADGTLAMATNVAGGTQNVTAGGMVLASTVTEDGVVNLTDKALARDTQLINGTLNNISSHDVNTQVGAQGKLRISGTETAIATSDSAQVEAGGTVTAGAHSVITHMTSAGTVTGTGGALFADTTVNDGTFTLDKARANNTTLNNGLFELNAGATADGVTLTGGKFNLKARAQAMKVVIEQGELFAAGLLENLTLRGGSATFTDSATVTGTLHSGANSVISVYQGANTTQADLNLAGRVALFTDDVAQAAKLPARTARAAGNGLPVQFTFKQVDLQGGTVDMSNTQNAQLTMDSLTGHGTFNLGSTLQQDAAAPLNVIHDANGNFLIQIDGSGIDPTNLNILNIGGGGDARFALTDGPVGLGNHLYDLVRGPDGKVTLMADPSTLTPGTAGILAVANTTPVIFNAELSSIQQRLDTQTTEANASGMWGTYLNNQFAVKGRAANFDQTLNGITLGGDTATPLADGVFSIGGFTSTSGSTIKTDYQSNGKVDSQSFGAYAQYLANNGYYLNSVVKANRFNQDINITRADTRASGNTHFAGMGVALKAGKHINYNDVYVSPYMAISAFSAGQSAVKLSNGMAAQSSSTRSAIGTLGANAGYRFMLNNGVEMKPYISASVDHEFAANNKVQVNSETFDNNLNGTRINGGVGINVNLTSALSVDSAVKLSTGKNIKTPMTINLGVAYRF